MLFFQFVLFFLFLQHGGYISTSHADDIAFIQLDTPVDVTGHYVRTACFGSRDLIWSSDDVCYASGWGYTKGKSSTFGSAFSLMS